MKTRSHRTTECAKLGPRGHPWAHSVKKSPYLGLAGALVAAGSVCAQSNPQPPPDEAEPAQTVTVTVTAKPLEYTSTIDKRSYSLGNDLKRTSGSIADALGDLPAVQVDPNGNVSLRGDPSVTILIDGKPSAMLSGPNRSQAILALPANQFDRVEVMTTPPASYKAEGTGGIINLITRKGPHTPETSGSVELNAGTGDRYNGGLNLAYNSNGLSATGAANFRHTDTRVDELIGFKLPDSTSGVLTPASQTGRTLSKGNVATFTGGVDYDVDAKTHLSATLNILEDRTTAGLSNTYQSAAPLGPLALDYYDNGQFHGHYSSNAATATYLRKLPGDDHELSISTSLSSDHLYVSYPTSYVYQAPIQPDFFQDRSMVVDSQELQVTARYKTPLANKAKLVAGYEFQIDQARSGNLGLVGTSMEDALPSSTFDDTFKFQQQVHALYLTYEQALGKFTLEPGLRLEETFISTDQVTTASKSSQNYFQAYPTVNLTYDLNDDQQIKLSYSRRVQRPNVYSLNPFRVEQSPIAFMSGNSSLKPQITDSYELSFEYHLKEVNYQATVYYRNNQGLFTTITQNLQNAALLTTWENLGQSQNAGLELVVNRPITRTVSVNASTNLFVNQVDAANLGILRTRTALLESGRVTLNWQVSKNDFVQLSAVDDGRQLTPQGYTDTYVSLDLGWRHKFNDKLSSVATFQDPFNAYRERTVIDTPMLQEDDRQLTRLRAVFFGFTYSFGGPAKIDKDIDFGGNTPSAVPK